MIVDVSIVHLFTDSLAGKDKKKRRITMLLPDSVGFIGRFEVDGNDGRSIDDIADSSIESAARHTAVLDISQLGDLNLMQLLF